MFVLSFNVIPYFQLGKTFFLFNKKHEPKTDNIFSILSNKYHSYEAV